MQTFHKIIYYLAIVSVILTAIACIPIPVLTILGDYFSALFSISEQFRMCLLFDDLRMTSLIICMAFCLVSIFLTFILLVLELRKLVLELRKYVQK